MQEQSTGTTEPTERIEPVEQSGGASAEHVELPEPAAIEPPYPAARHYTRNPLLSTLLDALTATGTAVTPLDSDALAPMDELHTGGRRATELLAELLDPAPGDRVLDLGSGLGGPARYLARHRGCQVTGVDLARENVEVAAELARRCGLADSVTFRQADVTALPFPDGSFDAALLLHVGMTVPSKAGLCAQAARVLRPGGRFVLYDVMQLTEDDGELVYPLPWASSPETSFLEPVTEYRRLLTEAGFEIQEEHDLRELALSQLEKLRTIEPDNLPPVGPHVVLGENFRAKIGNLVDAMAKGVLAPIQLLALR